MTVVVFSAAHAHLAPAFSRRRAIPARRNRRAPACPPALEGSRSRTRTWRSAGDGDVRTDVAVGIGGHTRTGGEDVTAQWFGQFEIYVDGARKLDVLRATTEWERPTPGLKSMRVTFGGDASRGHGVFMTRHEQSRDGIDVAAVPLDGRAIGERPAEQLTVAAGGARLRIIDSAARKFNATVDRVHYSHLNLKLDEIPKNVDAAP